MTSLDQIQLKLSNLQYLNAEETTYLCNYLFTNQATQLEFNNILNSLNCRSLNNASIFSCNETKTILQYLYTKLNTSLTLVNKSNNATITPKYFTFFSTKSTAFNIDLYVNLMLACYFQYKNEINQLSIYPIKYVNNNCKADVAHLLNQTITYTNFITVDNNIDFFNSFYDQSSMYPLSNPFLDILATVKSYSTAYILNSYIATNSSTVQNYYANQYDNTFHLLQTNNTLVQIANSTIISDVQNYSWSSRTITTAHIILENQFLNNVNYDTLILEGLTKSYLLTDTPDFYIQYVLLLTSIILSEVYNDTIDDIYTDMLDNLLLNNKIKLYMTTGSINS